MKDKQKPTRVSIPNWTNTPSYIMPLNGDGIGYVESFDFSRANESDESRIAAITAVASVCYGNPKAAGSISLYDRLANESAGLPSSSFEFVPVLIKIEIDCWEDEMLFNICHRHCIKYGEYLSVNEDTYLLTNLRALMADRNVVDDISGHSVSQVDNYYNTDPIEQEIIRNNFKVFRAKIDLSTRAQLVRHRVTFQELSRRYVSGSRSKFEFYVDNKLSSKQQIKMHVENRRAVEHYDELIADGIKPERARRVLPQSMYTTIWSAWQPNQLESYLKLRLDSHTQGEHRDLAFAMNQLSVEQI